MKLRILTGVILLMISTLVSAQFVGDGAAKPETGEINKNRKGNFHIKIRCRHAPR